jgi:probable biosynthetic protein (TIGR04099 family)
MSLAQRAAAEPALAESHVLGMAEMGYRGLSEQWLMRRAGDLHWRLIARAMGQAEAVFACAEGRPLYAAFCASRLVVERPDAPRLGGRLDLSARLFRVGRSRLGSLVALRDDEGTLGRIALVSAFVGRTEGGGNRSLARRAPRALALPSATSVELDTLARGAGRVSALLRGRAPEGQGLRLTPCPALDFNAAGLLYFPSFAALADRAEWAAGRAPDRPLAAREAVFLGNVEPGEPVEIRLFPRRRGRAALLSGADGRPLALLGMRQAGEYCM